MHAVPRPCWRGYDRRWHAPGGAQREAQFAQLRAAIGTTPTHMKKHEHAIVCMIDPTRHKYMTVCMCQCVCLSLFQQSVCRREGAAYDASDVLALVQYDFQRPSWGGRWSRFRRGLPATRVWRRWRRWAPRNTFSTSFGICLTVAFSDTSTLRAALGRGGCDVRGLPPASHAPRLPTAVPARSLGCQAQALHWTPPPDSSQRPQPSSGRMRTIQRERGQFGLCTPTPELRIKTPRAQLMATQSEVPGIKCFKIAMHSAMKQI